MRKSTNWPGLMSYWCWRMPLRLSGPLTRGVAPVPWATWPPLRSFQPSLWAAMAMAAPYSRALAGLVETPFIHPECTSAWAQFSVQSNGREALQRKLQDAGIPTAIYYPKPLHLQPAFAHLGYQPGDFPVSERLAARIFSLPMHPYLSAADQEDIVRAMASY